MQDGFNDKQNSLLPFCSASEFYCYNSTDSMSVLCCALNSKPFRTCAENSPEFSAEVKKALISSPLHLYVATARCLDTETIRLITSDVISIYILMSHQRLSVYLSRSTNLPMKTALFWVIKQRVVAIPYRRFGSTCQSRLQGSRIQKESQ